MRNPRASTGWSLELLFMNIMFPKGFKAEEEGVPGSEIGVHDCE
jgi:hypothetical protein